MKIFAAETITSTPKNWLTVSEMLSATGMTNERADRQ